MAVIFLGDLSDNSISIITAYSNKFLPDAEIKLLSSSTVRGKIKNQGKSSDVRLIVLDAPLYEKCEGIAQDVLSLSKVHRYVDDDTLKGFLSSYFGEAKSDSAPTVETEPKVVAEPSGVSESVNVSVELDELRSVLNLKEVRIRNLQQQIKELSEGDVSSDFYINKIKELESRLSESASELEKLREADALSQKNIEDSEVLKSKLDTLSEELNRCNSELGSMQRANADLEIKVSAYEKQIDDLSSKNASLSESSDSLSKSEEENQILSGKYSSLLGEVEMLKEDKSKSDAEVVETLKKVESLSESLHQVETELSELKKSNLELSDEKNALQEKLSGLDDLTAEVARLQNEIASKDTQLGEYSEKLGVLEGENSGLSVTLASVSEELQLYKDEAVSMNSALNVLKEKLTSTTSELDEAKSQLSSMQDSSEADDEVEYLRGELAKCESSVESLKKELDDSQSKAADMLLQSQQSVSDMAEKLRVTAAESSEATALVSELTGRAEALKADVERYKAQVSDLTSSLSERTNDVDVLVSQLEVAKFENEELVRSNAEAEKKLQGYSESKQSDSELEQLRAELALTKGELQKSKLGNVTSSEYSGEVAKLKRELAECLNKNSKLNLTVVECTEALHRLENSIFTELSHCSDANNYVSATLKMPNKKMNNMYLFACGNSESNINMYRAIEEAVSVETGKRVLVLDLVTDSIIDTSLSAKNVPAGKAWLQGDAKLSDCAVPTKYGGVFLVSTALAYLNELFLLKVDWEKRLEEAAADYDVVIVSIGCLGASVRDTLFNSFRNVMEAHVIAKASPSGLRTTLLHLSAFLTTEDYGSFVVSCVDYRSANANKMYDKLSSKFTTRIIRPDDKFKL